ncbi:lung seven transmembrane receptor-domain-containing protein [Pelagophyceae sp. CCMP2097]|nr:lung seven transmembrane receptor-domain-containing protein [Pelagophyceae sp. CCMP2097]
MRARALRWHYLLAVCGAYKWDIRQMYTEDKMSFSEMFMYGQNSGPWPFTAGDSYIQIHLAGVVYGAKGPANLTVASFTTPDQVSLNDVDLCTDRLPAGATRLQKKDFVLNAPHDETVAPTSMDFTDDVEEPKGAFKARFAVKEAGLQYVVFQLCEAFDTVYLNGGITFRNPYGYLPGMYFGFLPFEGARAFLFLIFQVGYIVLLILHRDRLLPLHGAILAVSLLASAEAVTWFAAYLSLNVTGEPLCCPFAPHVVAAMSLEMLRRTASRVLLLVVSLGFGLVRPSLSIKETLGVSSLTLCYLSSSIFVTVHKIREASDLSTAGGSSMALDLPVLFFDLCFLVWIYMALVSMTDVLHSTGQTYKLEMYSNLAYVIAAFVCLVTIFSLFIFLSKTGAFQWPWQLYWAQTVPLEILNLVIIAAVCVIWRPTERSKLMAQMQQLSTSDEAFDEDGLEMAEQAENGADEDDDGHHD